MMASSEWRIGFNIHPRWIDGSDLTTFLRPMRAAGLSSLEFELDDHLERWDAFQPLMETAVENGLALSFHAPYRQPHSILGFSGDRRATIEQDYSPLLQIAQSWAERLGHPCPVVFHAAMSPQPYPANALVVDTIAFLRWVCVTFPNLLVALENNHPPVGQQVKVGVNLADVLAITDQVGGSQVGVCWDLGHDFLRHIDQPPPLPWLERVVHAHVHDVDDGGLDHYPLIFGNVPVARWLRALRAVSSKGTVVLEIKGENLRNWSSKRIMEALSSSIAEITGVMR